MNLEINSRGADLSPQLEKYVRTKVAKIEKLFDRIISIRVVFTKEKFTHRAEVVVVDRHGTTKVRESTEDFRSAFDLVLRKLETRGRREKELVKEEKRRKSPVRRAAARASWNVDVLDRLSLADEEGPRVVKKTSLPIVSLSVEDAAISLDRSKNEFIVFRDSATDKVTVLYRRKDNNFGLIAPEF